MLNMYSGDCCQNPGKRMNSRSYFENKMRSFAGQRSTVADTFRIPLSPVFEVFLRLCTPQSVLQRPPPEARGPSISSLRFQKLISGLLPYFATLPRGNQRIQPLPTSIGRPATLQEASRESKAFYLTGLHGRHTQNRACKEEQEESPQPQRVNNS